MAEEQLGAILAVDTAGPVVGVASWSPLDGGSVREWSLRVVRGADRHLAPALQDQLAWLDAQAVPLAAVVVSVGPGSFTSLRVGVACALGLAMARGVPVLPVSSLWARACLVDEPVLTLLDARKSRVYAASYHHDEHGLPQLVGLERDVSLEEALVGAPRAAVGEGAVVFASALEAAGLEPVEGAGRSPCAEMAGRARWRLDEAVDAGAVALRYLRPPDARLPKPRPR